MFPTFALPDEDPEVQKLFTKPTIGQLTQPKPAPAPQYTVAEIGDTPEDIADKLGMDELAFKAENPEVQAGAAYDNMALIEEVYGNYGELLTSRIWGDDLYGPGTTAEPLDIGGGYEMVFPEGWNPEYAAAFIAQTEDRAYWENFYGLEDSLSKESYFAGSEAEFAAHKERLSKYQPMDDAEIFQMMQESVALENYQKVQTIESITGLDYLTAEDFEALGPGGMPISPFYEVNEMTGEWMRKNPEEVFDELYVANGIDPDDDEMVELFWSYANDDLIYMGEFFDVIEWPKGGYGGYGSLPTPYRMATRGSTPTRGTYSSYLQLTSWNI